MEEKKLPEHTIGLPGGGWALWKWVGLRGTGFPAGTIFKLAAPEAARAANLVIEAEQRLEQAKNDILSQINSRLDELRRNNEWRNTEKSRPLLRALSRVKADKIPEHEEMRDAVEALRSASQDVERLRKEFGSRYESSMRGLSNTIREIAASDRFREAVIWQNRLAYRTAIDPILRSSLDATSHSSKRKQHEQMVASYIQRYCVKNDTIGFFGPVGWARFTQEGKGLSLDHGKSFIKDRKTYFETWCISAVAKSIAANSSIKLWLKPILNPFLRLDASALHHPVYGPIKLSPAQMKVLGLCDGNLTAREIAQIVMEDPRNGFIGDGQVCDLLEQMAARGLLTYAFNIPLGPFPEKVLRRAIQDIGDFEIRAEALAALGEIERARSAVAESAGKPDQLEHALESLETTFTRLTGEAPTREAGKMYAARTLVYEDCRRDMDIRIGPDILDSLAGPLSLLLTSGRWFTFQYAKLYRKVFQRIYGDMVRKGNSRRIDAASFWVQAVPFVFGDRSKISSPVLAEFKKRWEGILQLDSSERRVQYSVEQLRPRVLAAFDVPRAGWSCARYHSPDILIAAPSCDHIKRGDYQLILSEFHLGANTLGASLFFHQHPAPESLIRARELDLPELTAEPVTPKELGEITARTMPMLASPNSLQLEVARDSFVLDRSKALPISAFFIEEDKGELILRSRDGRHEFDLIEVSGAALSGKVCDSFRVLAARPHTPRITIDRLVISRETWGFSAPDLSFAFEKSDAGRFLGARRWAQAHDMPRLVFTKVAIERKPFYVDFDSPVFVNLFSKMVRRAAESGSGEMAVTVSEMLPAPDQIWLEDADGERYTSEFRIVALDKSSG